MGNLNIPGTSIKYSNPEQIDQTTLSWQAGLTLTSQPTPQGGTGYGWMAIPKPGSFDATVPIAAPVLFGQQPASLASDGISIPNSTTTVKNPA